MSRRYHATLSAVICASLLALFGCGGGGSSTGGGTLPQKSIPPTVAFTGWVPNDSPLLQYKVYSFSASATDPNIGGSITQFQWAFGDGSTQVSPVVLSGGKATSTVTYAYTTAGTPTLSVVAQDAAGLLSTAATQAFTVTAAPSPLSVAFTSPTSATTINPAVGASVPVTFAVQVTNTGSGTISASGVTLNPGDVTATVGTPTNMGSGLWDIVVTYPAAGAIGVRTATPTIQIQDSNGLTSSVVTGPAITVNTVSTTDHAPVITLVATPVISAGTNATYQNVPVAFTATATDPDGDTLTYTWTFGDGGNGDVTATQNASALSQTHTFAAAGVYPVVFTADDGRGVAGVSVKSITLNLNILANGPPTVAVGWTDPVGNVSSLNTYANVPLTFTATATDPNGDPVALSWNFGDGSAVFTGQTPPPHSFAAVGATTVQVTATDGKGGVTTWSATLNVQQNRPPVAQVTTAVGNLFQDKVYTFTASATDPDAGDTIALYNWNFGDGTPIVSSATNTQTHAYASTYLGSASVSVSAMDNHGSTGNFSPAAVFTVVTTPLPAGAFVTPAGAATYNTELGAAGVTVTYVVSMTNPNGTGFLPLSALTFYPGEAAAALLSATANGNGTYTYQVRYAPAATAIPRTVTPTLVATDLQGITGLVQTGGPVTINTQTVNHPPQITFTSTSTPSAGTNASWQGVAFTFAGTATDPDSDAMTYAIAFGDTGGAGNIPTTPVPASGAISAAHTYAAPGIYSAVLTVSDGRTNGTVTITLNMNIQANAAPTVTATVADPFNNPVTANTYTNVPLTFTATTADANGDTVTLTWNFGDGTPTVTGIGLVQTHTFIATGSIPVVVTADDGKGNAGPAPTWSKTLNVLANHAPVAKVTSAAATLDMNKTYTFTASATDADAGDTIDHYIWNFGDGSTTGLISAGGAATSTTHVYAAAGTYAVSVSAMDNHGSTGNYSPAVTFTVAASVNPVVTFASPAATLSLNTGSTVSQDILFTVTNPNVSLGATSPLPTTGIAFSANDSVGTTTLLGVTSLGGTSYKATVRYAAAASSGTRTATPSASAQDSLGIPNVPVAVAGNPITIVTGSFGNPSIGVTNPTTASNTAFTLASNTLSFSLTNPTANPTTYTVNWGDGTTPVSAVISDPTLATTGYSVTLSHAYQASGTFMVTISANDNRSDSTSTAVPQYRTYIVSANTYPTATITTPQASATLPVAINTQNPASPVIKLTPGATDPAIVVIPLNGQLNFAGTSTGPSSGNYQSQWTFQGGVPNAFLGDTPGPVAFPGQAGQIVAYLVTYTAVDQFGRSSSSAPGVTANTYEKWVVVDGVNTQNFNLTFQYRQKSDNNGTALLTTVQNPANGLGAKVQIFQDGANNTFPVQDSQAINATISIPVRSNLPFYVEIPSFGSDSNGYMMRIPNAPSTAVNDPANGAYVDVSLGSVLNPSATVSNFGFESTTTAPWNPTLNLVTAQGFAAETAVANLRTLNGTYALWVGGANPVDDRWLSRLSVPATETLPTQAIPSAWNFSNVLTVTITQGFSAYQAFADWPIVLETLATPDNTTPGTPNDLEFKFDYESYKTGSALSKSFAASMMQAFRAPKGVTSPYDLDNANWGRNSAISNLNPTSVDSSVPGFYYGAAFNPVGTTTLAGGLQDLSIPYDPTDTADRVVLATPVQRNFVPIVRLFGYSEYIWTNVWEWPLVLNSALLNSADTEGLNAYSNFRYSNPLNATPTTYAHWPSVLGISSTDTSSFNLNANGGSDFNPSGSPVSSTTSPGPSANATGHFFWTVFSPFYSSAGASIIARSWLAQGTSDSLPGQPPTLFSGSSTDATAAYGFVPPQDAVVDKRTRNADGSINYSVSTLNGYRVNWFNPTKDSSGNVVAPDFWVVELNVGSTKSDFMLPGNFPASYPASTVDPATMPILTDARTTLVHPVDSTPLSGLAVVAPGYCWFDVPVELRPATGSSTTTLTVYAVKSILSNHAPAGARPLNRTEWIEAIKTASAAISLLTNGSQDLSKAYKIPFNYYWDIVITNGPITTVAQ